MPRTTRSNIAVLIAFLAVVVGTVMVAACQPPPQPLDLATVAPCLTEDGPGPDGPAPCVWDTAMRGCNDPVLVASSPQHQAVCPLATPSPYRWLLYSSDLCPVETVQSALDVVCVHRWDWSGGLSGTRP